MPNYDGFNELRIFYSTVPSGEELLEHRMTLDFVPDTEYPAGTPFEDIYAVAKNGSTTSLSSTVDALVVLLQPFYNATTTFIRAEYWRYEPEPSQNSYFMAAYSIGEPGTAVSATVPAAQHTFTFRTFAGGSMRLQLMEPSSNNNIKDPYPFSSSGANALADHLTAPTGRFVGRDNSYPIGAVYWSQTQNERLYRKRYRG